MLIDERLEPPLIGSRIRCVIYGSEIKVGEVYTVKQVHMKVPAYWGSKWGISLEGIPNASLNGWMSRRFVEAVEDTFEQDGEE